VAKHAYSSGNTGLGELGIGSGSEKCVCWMSGRDEKKAALRGKARSGCLWLRRSGEKILASSCTVCLVILASIEAPLRLIRGSIYSP